jgi:hypothetical protein
MSVTPADSLAGILPVVISGNRPLLSHRSTSRLLAPLRGVTADPVWLVRDDRAAEYQRDGYEVATFPRDEAEAFAAEHWIGPDAYEPGGFLGCFTEREWACRLAAERGCWAVLQLDDNIKVIKLFGGYRVFRSAATSRGGLAFFADLLAAVTLATNSRMTGAKLDSLNPVAEPETFARPGFPYSLFLERVDVADREPYFGPIEEDILHAYQYGARPDAATATLVLPLLYQKEHKVSARSGMRPFYDNQRRSAGLQAVAPEMASVGIRASHSNGRGGRRVFHRMERGAIRTPLVVTDRPLFDAARACCSAIRDELRPALRADAERRLAKHARRSEVAAALLAGAST